MTVHHPVSRRMGALGLLVACALALVACDNVNTTVPYPEDTLPSIYDSGRTWTYAYRLERDAEDAAYDTTLTDTLRVRVANTNATVAGHTGLVEVESFSEDAPDRIARLWYVQSPDSLVEVAYQDPLSVSTVNLLRDKAAGPSRSAAAASFVDGLPSRILRQYGRRSAAPMAAQAEEDSTKGPTVREDPRVVLVAPLSDRQSWVSFREPFRQGRLVIGRERVETHAGAFGTVVIETTLSEAYDRFRMTDFVARDGLVRRVVTDTVEVRNDNGEPAGEAALRETFDLIDFVDPS